MSRQTNLYQENRNGDIYVWVEMAAVTARRGADKWLRFWLNQNLKLQGSIRVPAGTKHGEVIKLERDQIFKRFTLDTLRGSSIPDHDLAVPSGDLCVVVMIKNHAN